MSISTSSTRPAPPGQGRSGSVAGLEGASIRLGNAALWSSAACRGPHQEIFFPPNVTETRRAKRRREARAKEICETCPVMDVCLHIALQRNEQHGIWGGQTEKERRQVLTLASV